MPNGSRKRPSTGRRRSAAARASILDATIEVVAEVGYSNLSIERIASRAGVGKSTIYRWWSDKSTLVADALESRMPLPVVACTGNPRTDLRALIRAAARSHPADLGGATLAALASSIQDGSAAAGILRRFLRPQRDAARRVLRHAAADGLLPTDTDIEFVIDICFGTVFYRELVGRLTTDEAAVERLASLILEGRVPRIE